MITILYVNLCFGNCNEITVRQEHLNLISEDQSLQVLQVREVTVNKR